MSTGSIRTAEILRSAVPQHATLIQVHNIIEQAGQTSSETRAFLCFASLDVEFKEDLSHGRQGHGANNMAIVSRIPLDLVRNHQSKGSVKTRRNRTGWSPDYLVSPLQVPDEHYPRLFAVAQAAAWIGGVSATA